MEPADDGFDLALAEWLATWVCHALAGSVGAVANGCELLAGETVFAAETVDLIRTSAAAATRRLQFYRTAFGQPTSGPFVPSACRELLDAYLDAARGPSARVTVAWPEPVCDPGRIDSRIGQLALVMALLGTECLPRSGQITIRCEPHAVEVEASGRGARLDELQAAALTLSRDGLAPRTAPAVFAARLARVLGGEIIVFRAHDRIDLAAGPLTALKS